MEGRLPRSSRQGKRPRHRPKGRPEDSRTAMEEPTTLVIGGASDWPQRPARDKAHESRGAAARLPEREKVTGGAFDRVHTISETMIASIRGKRKVESGGTMNKDKIFKLAKGFRGRAKNCIRIARERVEKALQYSYRDRRNKKRDMRSLWIERINAGTRLHGFCHMMVSLLVGSHVYFLHVLADCLICFWSRFAILTFTARYRLYIPVRQVAGTRTARYRVVPPKIDRR
ncbi:hypothetical protein BHM03_00003281 [Ensete ventricosum]|nr:hypothetical protein BHM03_00003281 [Ensete ventricosum]